jgi:hypothetical protein
MNPAGGHRVSLGLALLLGALACALCAGLAVFGPDRVCDSSGGGGAIGTPLQQALDYEERQQPAVARVLDMCRKGELPATGRLCLDTLEVERGRFLAPAGPYHPTPLAAFWSLDRDADPTGDAAERPRTKASAP